MPVNATSEYYKAEDKFLKARTLDEKISALEEMIKALPKHKGSENLLALLRRRLARLKEEKEAKKKKKKSKRSEIAVKKEGAAQVCIIGFPNSGKSTLLKILTGKNIEISEKPYTTKKPEIGMMRIKGVKIQIVELPGTFKGYVYGILNNCDLILALLDTKQNLEEQELFLRTVIKEREWEPKTIFISSKGKLRGYLKFENKSDAEMIKEEIWKRLGIIRIFTKPPGKEPEKEALTFRKKATVRDVCERLGKDFLKSFKFARIFDQSKFSGRKVGLDYSLKDGDIVEIHTKS